MSVTERLQTLHANDNPHEVVHSLMNLGYKYSGKTHKNNITTHKLRYPSKITHDHGNARNRVMANHGFSHERSTDGHIYKHSNGAQAVFKSGTGGTRVIYQHTKV